MIAVHRFLLHGHMGHGYRDKYVLCFTQSCGACANGILEIMFGTMAAIVLFAYLLIVFMQVFGKRMRERSGPLKFKTD